MLATTFCIVAVFLPVAFMGGIIGRFFFQFGITVSAAVLISLFVSFTLDPMLSLDLARPAGATGNGPLRRESSIARQERAIGVYRAILRWALRLAASHAAERAARCFVASFFPCRDSSASSSCPRPISASSS